MTETKIVLSPPCEKSFYPFTFRQSELRLCLLFCAFAEKNDRPRFRSGAITAVYFLTTLAFLHLSSIMRLNCLMLPLVKPFTSACMPFVLLSISTQERSR